MPEIRLVGMEVGPALGNWPKAYLQPGVGRHAAARRRWTARRRALFVAPCSEA